MKELELSYLWGGPCKIGTFPVDRVYVGLVDIQATENRLSLSTEQCYISGEWSIGHALDFGQQQILRIFFLSIFASFALN